MSSDTLNLHVAGVPLSFPHTPYRAQVALMHAVVTAVKNKGNALVESPTGTGKSLALLCSSLAVQQYLAKEHENCQLIGIDARREAKRNGQAMNAVKKEANAHFEATGNVTASEHKKHKGSSTGLTTQRKTSSDTGTEPAGESHDGQRVAQRDGNDGKKKKKEEEKEEVVMHYSNNAIVDSDDDDFQPVRHRLPDVSWQNPVHKQRKRSSADRPEEVPENAFMLHARRDAPLDQAEDEDDEQQHDPDAKADGSDSDEPNKGDRKTIPRIFFGTRTHTQVTQVIRELRKTVYRPPLCILASRREYCVNEPVQKQAGRDDACKRLVAEQACVWYQSAAQLATHTELQESAWDIEELTTLGRRIHGCPYYASHDLYQQAKLILCPYSFLVDPIVRAARGIDLKGDIIILDEAHNIENYAREAASFSVDVAAIRHAIDEIDTIALTTRIHDEGTKQLMTAYRCIKGLFTSMLELVDNVLHSDLMTDGSKGGMSQASGGNRSGGGYDGEHAILQRQVMLTTLSGAGINMSEVKRWKNAYDFIRSFGDGKEEGRFQRMAFHEGPVIPFHETDSTMDDSGTATTQTDGSTAGDDDGGDHRRNRYGYGGGGGSYGTPSYQDDPSDRRRRMKRGRFPGASSMNRRAHHQSGHSNNNDNNNDNVNDDASWQAKCLSVCISALTTLDYLFFNDDDFTLVLSRKTQQMVTTVTLSLHCLNAAVSFRDISKRARTVIVTSGTLTPMNSFAGELGTVFRISKSLPHVVDVRRQVFVGVISHYQQGLAPGSSGPGPGSGSRSLVKMDATFYGSARFEFQDSLGHVLVDVAQAVPGGILVFFPSYRLIDVLCKRWKMTDVWNRLHLHKKRILTEPAQRGKEFDDIVALYNRLVSKDYDDDDGEGERERGHYDEEYGEVENANYDDNEYNYGYDENKHRQGNYDRTAHGFTNGMQKDENYGSHSGGERQAAAGGAMLFAVCRGKLSEGIDFRDDAARAVVIVGIPYPHKNDVVIAQKRQWNDRTRANARLAANDGKQDRTPSMKNKSTATGSLSCTERTSQTQLQTGGEWYEMQAFRALNQALGRAVRHRFDYGAILLVDARFTQQRVLAQLSKWTRDAVQHVGMPYPQTMQGLQAFFAGIHQRLADVADERSRNTAR